MIPKSACPLWLADIRSDPCRKARPSAVSYTTPVDTIEFNNNDYPSSMSLQQEWGASNGDGAEGKPDLSPAGDVRTRCSY